MLLKILLAIVIYFVGVFVTYWLGILYSMLFFEHEKGMSFEKTKHIALKKYGKELSEWSYGWFIFVPLCSPFLIAVTILLLFMKLAEATRSLNLGQKLFKTNEFN